MVPLSRYGSVTLGVFTLSVTFREPPKLSSSLRGTPFCATCLAAARSRSGSDSRLGCHSIPSRRFTTRSERLALSVSKAATSPKVRGLFFLKKQKKFSYPKKLRDGKLRGTTQIAGETIESCSKKLKINRNSASSATFAAFKASHARTHRPILPKRKASFTCLLSPTASSLRGYLIHILRSSYATII